jgi:hypothetical protein
MTAPSRGRCGGSHGHVVQPRAGTEAARGPLAVSTANPRYFTVASDRGKAVYLTGSHIWNNLHDGMGPGAACAEPSERLDHGAYLDFLAEHGHNFIRLWRWEQFKSQAAGGEFHLCMTPQPWREPGRERQRTASRDSTWTGSTGRSSTGSATVSSPRPGGASTSR